MRNTVLDFKVSTDKYISRELEYWDSISQTHAQPGADIIALSAVWGIAACGGPPVSYRGGRRAALGPTLIGFLFDCRLTN